MTLLRPHVALLFALCLMSATAGAKDEPEKRGDPTIDPILVAAGFLDSHPDLLHRSRGLDAYGKQDHPAAFEHFTRAARYADKPSQAIVAEMLWIGLGVGQDRALAWVWMDLAAERGYTSFTRKRDVYWQQLDDTERARAQREAEAIRAEYADQVAERRLALALVRDRKRSTGSRLGSNMSSLQINIPGVGTISGEQYYAPKYWEPALYREWQDSIWTDIDVTAGRVHVGEIDQIKEGAAQPAGDEEADSGSPQPDP